MTVQSPVGASGSKNITPRATNGAVTTNGNVVVFIIQPCTTNPPTFTTVAPVTQSGFPGDTKTYQVSVTNNDSASCSDRTFLFTTTMNPPSGNWTVSTPGALTLSPGSSGVRNINVTPDVGVSAGTYDIDVTTAAITVTFHYTVMTPTPSPTPPPLADFTSDVVSGAAPLTVNFTDTSTGNVSSWSWDFGDGGTSTQQNPSHDYLTPGTYTVVLQVTGPGGSDTRTRTGYITVT
jgi:PKD repeat protein